MSNVPIVYAPGYGSGSVLNFIGTGKYPTKKGDKNYENSYSEDTSFDTYVKNLAAAKATCLLADPANIDQDAIDSLVAHRIDWLVDLTDYFVKDESDGQYTYGKHITDAVTSATSYRNSDGTAYVPWGFHITSEISGVTYKTMTPEQIRTFHDQTTAMIAGAVTVATELRKRHPKGQIWAGLKPNVVAYNSQTASTDGISSDWIKQLDIGNDGITAGGFYLDHPEYVSQRVKQHVNFFMGVWVGLEAKDVTAAVPHAADQESFSGLMVWPEASTMMNALFNKGSDYNHRISDVAAMLK